MRAGHDLDRARVLACSVRLLDVGMFRIGSEVYEKEDGHLGLATIAKANVSIEQGRAIFDYIAKEGVRRVHAVADPSCVEIVGALKRRRGGGDHLLAFREGRAWHQVHAPLINAHLKSLIGDSFSAKNFRTWNGTLLAAVALARCEADCASERGRRRAIGRATSEVSQVLGNTPAVARGVLHRSARVRPLPVRLDDRRRAATHRGPGSLPRGAPRRGGAGRARLARGVDVRNAARSCQRSASIAVFSAARRAVSGVRTTRGQPCSYACPSSVARAAGWSEGSAGWLSSRDTSASRR